MKIAISLQSALTESPGLREHCFRRSLLHARATRAIFTWWVAVATSLSAVPIANSQMVLLAMLIARIINRSYVPQVAAYSILHLVTASDLSILRYRLPSDLDPL